MPEQAWGRFVGVVEISAAPRVRLQSRGMVLEAHLLKVEELPARGDYPASWLVSVLDMATADTYKLAADEDVARLLVPVKPLSPGALRLSCRRVPSDRGAAYKLRIVGVDKPAAS